MKPEQWTPHDDEMLRALWGRRGVLADRIAQQMGRSVSGVNSRAHKLGIYRPNRGEPMRLISVENDVATIAITGAGGNHTTTVDGSDLDWFMTNSYGWMAHREGKSIYVYERRSSGKKLHRLLLNAGAGSIIDHIDRNGLNNCRGNLRFVTSRQNGHNTGPRSHARSEYKGVWLHGPSGLYGGVVLGPDGHRHSIGYHKTEREAARSHDAIARYLRGEFAYLNLPNDPLSEEEIASRPAIVRIRDRPVPFRDAATESVVA